MFVEGGVYLAGTEDDAVDLLVGFDGIVFVGWIGNDPLEVRVACEVFNGGAGQWVAEE